VAEAGAMFGVIAIFSPVITLVVKSLPTTEGVVTITATVAEVFPHGAISGCV
jgi:hypothetical protein